MFVYHNSYVIEKTETSMLLVVNASRNQCRSDNMLNLIDIGVCAKNDNELYAASAGVFLLLTDILEHNFL